MGTTRLICVSTLVVWMAVLLGGCGGGGGGANLSEGSGTITGAVQESSDRAVRASGDDITVSIDGTDISTLADADGSFVLANVPPGLYTVVAQTRTRARAMVVSVEANRETHMGEIILAEAGQISGLVTSATTHQPIPGALVIVMEQVSDGDALTEDMPRPVRVRRTDALGSYTISGIPAGDYVVTISKPGYESVSLRRTVTAGSTTTGDAALKPIPSGETGSVEGTAYFKTDGGELIPLAGVFVQLISADRILADVAPMPPLSGDEPPPIPFPRQYYAFTGEDGTYRIDGVLPGDYTAVAIRRGFEIDHHPVTIVANDVSTVDFTMILYTPKLGIIEGTVTNSVTGNPIAGARVCAVWDAVSVSEGAIIMPADSVTRICCITDERGRYKLIVPSLVTAIHARASGFESKKVEVTVNPGSTITVDIELVPLEEPPPPPGDGGGENPPAPPEL